MTPRLVVRSAAEADIAAAALWYEERATGLGTLGIPAQFGH